MPIAAYRASTSSRTRSTITCRTRSTSSTPPMPRTAWSSAVSCRPTRSARACAWAAANANSSARASATACSASPASMSEPNGAPPPGATSGSMMAASAASASAMSRSGNGAARAARLATRTPSTDASSSTRSPTARRVTTFGSRRHASTASRSGGRTIERGASTPIGSSAVEAMREGYFAGSAICPGPRTLRTTRGRSPRSGRRS